MTELNPTQRRALRATAHHLNPVVSISQKGLTPTVLAEIDRCLKAHELIKVRLYGIERDTRPALFDEICHSLRCAQVQHIGNLLVLWRENPVDANAEKSALATRRPRKMGTKKQEAARNESSKRRKS
ncbi:MAG: YhbY family RNA-binding protein [Pseudomonadota bacterium]